MITREVEGRVQPWRSQCLLLVGLAGLAVLSAGRPSEAANISGSAFLTFTTVDNIGSSNETLDQRYSLQLGQELTQFFQLNFNYNYFDVGTQSQLDGAAQSVDISRRSRAPRLELLYDRETWSGRLSVEQRTSDGTIQTDNFEASNFYSSLSWRPRRAPSFKVEAGRGSNVTDPAALGRDTDTSFLRAETTYYRQYWSARYTYLANSLERKATGLLSDQQRHEGRFTASRGFMDDRLSFSFDSLLSQYDRLDRVPSGTEIGEPIPPIQGLFAVDLSPSLGELLPSPGLIDGDFNTPAPPGIDLGGANTFRNIGLDLGITRPITRLEITVDRPSAPGIAWSVYQSRDNLIWGRVEEVTVIYDPALLHYTLRIPETTDRFFKAVNESANPVTEVLVTEIRALLDVEGGSGDSEYGGTLYRASVAARFRPSERVSGRVNFGWTNQDDLFGGLVRRDFRSAQAGADLDVQITRELQFAVGYRHGDTEQGGAAPLARTTQTFESSLIWTPLPTVNAEFAVAQRDESSKGDLLQSTSSARASLFTGLLPDLDLTSTLLYVRLEDPFSGFNRDSWTLTEDFRTRPTRNWVLDASLQYSIIETPEGLPLLKRSAVRIRTNWIATRFLTLFGRWRYSRDNDLTTFRQSYTLTYTPGPRLTLTGAYDENENSVDRVQSSSSVSFTYSLLRRVNLFGNLSRSRTQSLGDLTAESDSAQIGLSIAF